MLTDEEFNALGASSIDVEKEKGEVKQKLTDFYFTIKDLLKEYCDLQEEYYDIIPLWIIGTYFHEHFPSFPYLYLNASKGSGKSRTMGLIVTLSKEGEMLNSLTEAVLFRTKGTLGIDEFESLERKGKESLRELLNSAYKKGVKVKRMKKAKTPLGEEQVVEKFDVYRPIVMANIWGMDNVLGDRCIEVILEKSGNTRVTNLIELFRNDPIVKELLQEMEVIAKNDRCSLCSVVALWKLYKGWNDYVKSNYTNNTNYTNYTNSTNYTNDNLFLYKTIKESNINGRDLELCLPLILIAREISEEVLKKTTLVLLEMMVAKREEEFVENKDTSLIDFVSQQSEMDLYIPITKITADFRNFLSTDEDWINVRWVGRALKRLKLIKQKRRVGSRGTEVILDSIKAKEKLRMFK